MEAQRCVKLTGTNEPCGLTIFFFFRCVCGRGNYRLQGIQLLARRSAMRKGGSLFEIVWDDRHGDETTLIAAFRPAGPQAASFPVAIGAGSHPFPFRTRKLSLPPPMVLRA